MTPEDAVVAVETLQPGPGDVVLVHLTEHAEDDAMRALATSLGDLAGRTRATVLLLPAGVTVEKIDDREMLARGWLRVGPIAHTTEQLAAPPRPPDEQLPSA